MNELASNIEYLLLSHNRVIVPGLGEFASRLTPARWIESEGIFLPPVRHVFFNADVTTDSEELLLHSVARLYGMNRQQAVSKCSGMIDSFHKMLVTHGSVDFGTIGVFTLEEDATITMASCECGISTPNYYGLDALSMDKIHEFVLPTTVPEAPAAELPDTPLPHQPEVSSHFVLRIHRNIVRYSVAVAASLAMFFVINPTRSSHPQALASTQIFMQPDMVPEAQSDPSLYYVDEAEDVSPTDCFDPVLVDYTEAALNEGYDFNEVPQSPGSTNTQPAQPALQPTQPAPQPAQSAPQPAPQSTSQSAYCIVLASSISEANAQSYIEKLNKRGVQASLLQKDNMRRVVVDGFHTEAECRAAMQQLKSDHADLSSAWLLKK